MLRKDYKFLILIKCLLFLILIESIWGQYCSVIVNSDTCEISLPKLKEIELKVFTINTKDNDGYKRFIYTANNFGINIHTIDHDLIYEDENNQRNKIKFLREIIRPFKNNKNMLILFTDSYNTIFANGPDKIIKDFINSKTNILFGTDNYHFVGHRLSRHYYENDIEEEKLLGGKIFIGFAPDIYKMFDDYDLEDEKYDDDDVYYTKLYLNENSRLEYGIQIDIQSRIIQNLYGELQNLKFKVDNDTLEGSLRNIKYRTTPSIIYGDGPSTIELNSFANYLGGTFKNGTCIICEKDLVTYTEDKLPIVSLSLFVEKALPFFEEFLDGIKTISYPKDRMHVFIHSNYHHHEQDIEKFVNNTRDQYKSLKLISTCDEIDETEARKLSVTEAIQKKSEFLFSIDSDVHINDPNILRDLLKYNKTFIGPVVKLQTCNYSNFWGDISRNGYYAKSHDYLDIVNEKIKGMWNVPFVNMIYLIHKSAFNKINFDHMKFDPDMALCESLRKEGIFMYIINTKIYGHLIDGEEYDLSLVSPEFYLLESNPKNWEKRYIQQNFHKQLDPNYTQNQPCPDVYWFHVTTERFCKDLVAIMEAFGKWSDGSHYDPRLDGGYEAVPTRDIHMNQVGLQEMWLHFLKTYVKPLKELVYHDNDNNDPYTDMNFVVRYRPDEQAYLRPHFDTSTYTINIALNTAGKDFQGGGCRFLRYNCSVTDTEMGWMLMHPGKLTHLHEGLLVTNGTRYIMVSFVDPYG